MVYPVNGTSGVYIASRIDKGGCESFAAQGIFFFYFPQNKTFEVHGDLGKIKSLNSILYHNLSIMLSLVSKAVSVLNNFFIPQQCVNYIG